MPIWVQWFSFVLAFIGSITGIWALCLNQIRTNITRRQEKERLEGKKKSKFSVDTAQKMSSKSMQNRFLLSNIGQADARNVFVEFYNYDREGNQKKCDPLMEEKVPTTINAGHTVDMLLVADFLSAPPYDIVIIWEDDNQKDNTTKLTLHI